MEQPWRDARSVRRRRRIRRLGSSAVLGLGLVAASVAMGAAAQDMDDGPGRVAAIRTSSLDLGTLTTSCGSFCAAVADAMACVAVETEMETCIATRQMNGATCQPRATGSSVLCLAPVDSKHWTLLLTEDPELQTNAKNRIAVSDDIELVGALVLNASDVDAVKNFAPPIETTQLTLRAAAATQPTVTVSSDVVASWQMLERISVRDVDLSSLQMLPAFNKLVSLDLSNCRLKNWSTTATPALSILDVSSNELTKLPQGSLPLSLNVLNVSSNNLVEFPVDIASMPGLYRLSVSNNNLASLSKFPKLPALKELYLSSASFSAVPAGIANLPTLQVLDLSNNNFASAMTNAFPASMISFCSLQMLPGDFGIEKTWELVDLSENPFNDGAFNGVKLRVNNLILQQVQLTAISPNMKAWAVGNTLSLSKNALGAVNAEDLPADIAELRLAECFLKQVPENLASLRRLTILDLSENSFGPILSGSLPKMLTELHLANCNLGTVPVDVQAMNSSLLKLDLSSNNLTSVQLDSFSSLHDLDLRGNALQFIPLSIFTMSNLSSLDLRGNPIASLNLTDDQITFLSTKLRSFQIDAAAFAVDGTCVESAVLRGKYTLCKQLADATISTDGPSSSIPTPTPNSTTPIVTSTSTTLNIILGCAVGLVMIVSLIVARMPMSRRSHAENESYDPLATTNNRYGPMDMWEDPELLRWRVDILDVELVMQIGVGANSVLWLARYQTDTVAVKRLFHKKSDPRAFERFVEEIKFLGRLVHENVVQFLGVSWTSDTDLQMLLEFMPNGDLRKYLTNARTDANARAWSVRKLRIAIDVAEALHYLHSHDPTLLHRDLRSHHVLLDENYTAKLTDFGMCRQRVSELDLAAVSGNDSRSIAPEVLSGRGTFGKAVDMYAFGVILAELDNHEPPFSDITLSSGAPLSEMAMLELLSTGALQPSITPDCPSDIARLITDCLSFDSNRRPTTQNALLRLRFVLESFQALSVGTNDYDDSAERIDSSYVDRYDHKEEDDDDDNDSYRI